MAVALMTPRQLALYLGIALALIGTGVWIGASAGAKHYGAKASAAQAQADQHEGAAQTHAAQAAESDRQGAANRAAVLDADAKVQAAKRELAALKARLPKSAPVSIQSATDASASASVALVPSVPSAAGGQGLVISKQAAVIAAQDQEIAALKLQVSIEHASAVQWHQAYDESQKTLALQRIASDAALHEARNSGVRAQLIRGLEGLALGYVAGRVTR